MASVTPLQSAEPVEYEDRPLVTPFRLIIAVIVAGLVTWMSLYPDDWENWLGFSRYDYFTAGTNYAFASGPGPMILTAAGLSTIIAGLWHHTNCHTAGCPWIVRHKIAGGEYGVCGRCWRKIHGIPSEHKFTIEHLREHHIGHLKATGRWPGA